MLLKFGRFPRIQGNQVGSDGIEPKTGGCRLPLELLELDRVRFLLMRKWLVFSGRGLGELRLGL